MSGYLENEEVEELSKKAKANKTDKIVVTDKTKERAKRTVERKANPVKEEIIQVIANALHNYNNLPIAKIKVENVGKLITFYVNDKEFKLDLIEKRQKKA